MNTLQTRGLTWDYVCEIEAQRDELLAAMQRIAKEEPGILTDAALLTAIGRYARAAISKATKEKTP